ncbi:MAG TPA: hypothetical protein VKH42_09825 [Vicinamibacterales bacterium]|nr:hypothetical protein [Vicinamibacterales bacterium]
MDALSGVSILAGLVAAGVIARLTAWAYGRTRTPNLGSISTQWLSEHRHSQTQERP